MQARWVLGIVAAAVAASPAMAQQGPTATNLDNKLYCSGIMTQESVPHDAAVVSGEFSRDEMGYLPGQIVNINRGADKGVKVGDEFSVIRETHEQSRTEWFTGQRMLLRAMGATWMDVGRIRVVNVQAKTASAEISSSCEPMERGDTILPFQPREVPEVRPASAMDKFAPATDKPKTAMVVTTKEFGEAAAQNSTVFVNLGAAHGVKVGTYFRIFRYQGDGNQRVYQTAGSAYMMYGYGSAPARYAWDDLPRDVVGEGVVLRVTKNSATVLITTARVDIVAGDYVEVEQ
jgi:hypothetical protein